MDIQSIVSATCVPINFPPKRKSKIDPNKVYIEPKVAYDVGTDSSDWCLGFFLTHRKLQIIHVYQWTPCIISFYSSPLKPSIRF